MKNEHAILAAHFLSSIVVQLCVLLPYSVLRQWREVYPCASRAPVNHCAIRVIILHNFGQMCPCSLLAGAHITFVGAHLKRPQHRHAMQCLTHPFRNSSGSVFSILIPPFFTLAPFVVDHVCFLVDIRLLPP